jgi:hypothetical protein
MANPIRIVVMAFCCLAVFASVLQADLVTVSNKVGQKIDPKERAQYALFEREGNFSYAVFLQLKDGTYTLNIIYNDGSAKTRLLEDDEFTAFRKYIDSFSTIKPRIAFKSNFNLREGLFYALFISVGSAILIEGDRLVESLK